MGLSGSNPVGALAGSNAKIFPTAAALILISLKVDAELNEDSTIMSSLFVIFSVTGRSMMQSFLVGETK